MSLLAYLQAGAAAGLCSGLLAWALELAFLPSTELSWRVGLLAGGALLPGGFAVGLALAALLFAVRAGCAAFGARARRHEAALLAALATAASVPLWLWVVQRLASGRIAARHLGAPTRQALLVAVAAVLVGAAAYAGLRLARHLAGDGRRLRALSVGLLLAGCAAGFFWADAHLYRRLYTYLHALLFVGYAAAGLLAGLALLRAAGLRAVRRRPALFSLVGASAAAVIAPWLTMTAVGADHQLRFVLLEHSTAAGKLLAAAPATDDPATPTFLSLAVPHSGRGEQRHRVPGANVVLVTVDAMRGDRLGAAGYRRGLTPTLDALAARAVRFDRAYAQTPLTCYSVPSLHTGDYLRSTLALLPKPPATLARILGARGYTTAAFYHQDIFFCDDERATGYGKHRFGFDHVDTKLYSAAPLTDRVIDYLRRFRAEKRGRLFLWAHYFDVHEPYHRHAEFDFGPRSVDRYDSEIAYVDSALKHLIAALGQLPQPTILVVTADHGEEFREHGGSYHGSTLYEEQVRVPLIFAVPGLKPHVSRDPVQVVDVAPTVLSLLGLRVPESMRGTSLVPQLMGHRDPARAAFSEVHTKKAAWLGDWKLIHDFRRRTYELYDLAADRQERNNLYARRPRQAERLKGRLQQWFDQLSEAGAAEEGRPEGIDLGRIGDRRALPLLAALVRDPFAASRWRQEAARLLGAMHDPRAADALWIAASDDDRAVADEVAIALGEVQDRRAQVLLRRTLRSTDNDLRIRAGIAMARTDSPEATPALLEALQAGGWELQHRAVHYLGSVGDRRAIGPLLAAAQRGYLTGRVAPALGHVGQRHFDRRIFPLLLDLAQRSPHPDVRQHALAGLAFLGERRAVPPLIRLLSDPELTWVPEALTRLGALGRQLPGIDLAPGVKGGWRRCHTHRSMSMDNFLGQTWCAMGAQATAQLTLSRPPSAARLLLRARPLLAPLAGRQLVLTLNGRPLPRLTLKRAWQAYAVELPQRALRPGRNQLKLRIEGPGGLPEGDWVGVDYVIVTRRAAG